MSKRWDLKELDAEFNPPPKSPSYLFGIWLGEMIIRYWPLGALAIAGLIAYGVMR